MLPWNSNRATSALARLVAWKLGSSMEMNSMPWDARWANVFLNNVTTCSVESSMVWLIYITFYKPCIIYALVKPTHRSCRIYLFLGMSATTDSICITSILAAKVKIFPRSRRLPMLLSWEHLLLIEYSQRITSVFQICYWGNVPIQYLLGRNLNRYSPQLVPNKSDFNALNPSHDHSAIVLHSLRSQKNFAIT